MTFDHMRIFGTHCFVHVPKQKRRKGDKKSVVGQFVGYCGDKDGHRVWVEEQNKVILCRDVIFKDETPLKRNLFVLLVKYEEKREAQVLPLVRQKKRVKELLWRKLLPQKRLSSRRKLLP